MSLASFSRKAVAVAAASIVGLTTYGLPAQAATGDLASFTTTASVNQIIIPSGNTSVTFTDTITCSTQQATPSFWYNFLSGIGSPITTINDELAAGATYQGDGNIAVSEKTYNLTQPGEYTANSYGAGFCSGPWYNPDTNSYYNSNQVVVEVYDTPAFGLTALDALTAGSFIQNDLNGYGWGLTYTVTAGTLPDGLTLDAATGRIEGTPTTAGPYDFTVTATNPAGSTPQQFTGTIAEAPAVPGVPFSFDATDLNASGDSTTLSWPDSTNGEWACFVLDGMPFNCSPVGSAGSMAFTWDDVTNIFSGMGYDVTQQHTFGVAVYAASDIFNGSPWEGASVLNSASVTLHPAAVDPANYTLTVTNDLVDGPGEFQTYTTNAPGSAHVAWALDGVVTDVGQLQQFSTTPLWDWYNITDTAKELTLILLPDNSPVAVGDLVSSITDAYAMATGIYGPQGAPVQQDLISFDKNEINEGDSFNFVINGDLTGKTRCEFFDGVLAGCYDATGYQGISNGDWAGAHGYWGTGTYTLRLYNTADLGGNNPDFTTAYVETHNLVINAAAVVNPPVVNAPTFGNSTIDLTAGTQNSNYSGTVTANGDNVTYSIKDGNSLPAGLTLDPATGAITGTPTTPGDYTFIIVATNAGGSAEVTVNLHINSVVTPPVVIAGKTIKVTFGGNSAKLSTAAKKALQALVAVAHDKGLTQIDVTAYTKSTAGATKAQRTKLAKARAAAIKKYILSLDGDLTVTTKAKGLVSGKGRTATIVLKDGVANI